MTLSLKNRFDAVEILIDAETQETMFVVVLGIFSLTTFEENGQYKCRHGRIRTCLADTFIVGAQLKKIIVQQKERSSMTCFHIPYINIGLGCEPKSLS